MSIRKHSATEWEHEFAAGDDNDCHTLAATRDGLKIDYDILPWADIDAARAALGQKSEPHTKAIEALKQVQKNTDPESAHPKADEVLCDLLNSLGYADVVAEYENVRRWYA